MPEILGLCKKAMLRRNSISRIVLNRCESLLELDLYDNKIRQIENLDQAPNLRILDLSFNLISENNVTSIPSLTELYLIGNDIGRIGKMDLKSLEKLDMAENCIEQIENLEGVPRLRELYLGCNSISSVRNLAHLSSLEVLDLQGNNLTTLDCADLPSTIKTLLLHENHNLTEIKNIDLLKRLDLLGISKTNIDPGTIKRGSKAEIWI